MNTIYDTLNDRQKEAVLRSFLGHKKISMLCPTACRSPALSVTEAVYTTDFLYVLFSDNTSQDTFPVPVLYNDDVHSCRHSRVWKPHNTYAL